MKRLPLFVTLGFLFAASALAAPLAIFSRSDAHPINGTAVAPTGKPQVAFFAEYVRDRQAGAPYESELPLVNPPAWGRTVSPHTGGMVSYHPSFVHGFVCRVQLHDLLPNHPYLLTLNGNPEKAGNTLLPTPVPGNPREKYYDFLDIKTDAHGSYDGELGICLQPGAYDVRLYVKDPADFKIVLYRDFFRFSVK